jgi:hypothetical protein
MVVYINHEFADYMKNYLKRQGFSNVRVKAIVILRHAVAVYFKASRNDEYVAWIPRNNKLVVKDYRSAEKLPDRGEYVVVPRRKERFFLYSAKIYRIRRVGEDGYVRKHLLRLGPYRRPIYAVFIVNDERLDMEIRRARFSAAAVLHGVGT